MAVKKTQAQIKKLWEDYRVEMLQIYATENRKPVTHAQLTKSFVDSNGMQYYSFSKDMLFPVERHGKLLFYMNHIAKMLSSEEDEMVDDTIANAVMNGTDLTKIKIAVGAIMAEKRKRREMCIHTELFYNYLALHYIREDEAPEYFDNDIQMQKVVQFHEEVKKKGSSYHFFQVPEFKKLNDMLMLSQIEWDEQWQNSLQQERNLPQALKIFSNSAILQEIKKKISKADSLVFAKGI